MSKVTFTKFLEEELAKMRLTTANCELPLIECSLVNIAMDKICTAILHAEIRAVRENTETIQKGMLDQLPTVAGH